MYLNTRSPPRRTQELIQAQYLTEVLSYAGAPLLRTILLAASVNLLHTLALWGLGTSDIPHHFSRA